MNEAGIIGKAVERLPTMTGVQLGVLAWSSLLTLVLYVSTVIGATAMAKERRWFALALLVIPIAYLVLLSAGAEAYSRFRIPIIPVLALLGGVGLEPFLRRERDPAVEPSAAQPQA